MKKSRRPILNGITAAAARIGRNIASLAMRTRAQEAEHYWAQSNNMTDLERRMRTLEHNHHLSGFAAWRP